MLGMLKRHEVEILLKAGHAKSEVARLAKTGFRGPSGVGEATRFKPGVSGNPKGISASSRILLGIDNCSGWRIRLGTRRYSNRIKQEAQPMFNLWQSRRCHRTGSINSSGRVLRILLS